MFGKYKISFNCEKETSKKLDELSEFYFCSKTEIINKALKDYFVKHDKKIQRKNNIKKTYQK